MAGGRTDGGQQQQRHLHVRRLGEPARPPAQRNGESDRLAAASDPTASSLRAADRPAHRSRRLERDPVRRTAADHHEPAVPQRPPLPVAVARARAPAGARRAPCRAPANAPRSPSHSAVPTRGRNVVAGNAARSSASSAAVRWLTHATSVGKPGGREPAQPVADLGRRVGSRRAGRSAGGRRNPPAVRRPAARGTCRDVVGGQAVPVHRGQALEHDPLAALQRAQPVEVRDGLHARRAAAIIVGMS